MNKYDNFKHLDAFYKKIAKLSDFEIKENESIVINTGLNHAVFNYVRFNSPALLFLEETINALKVPFIAFPDREMDETQFTEVSRISKLEKLGEVVAHGYQGLQNFSFEKTILNLDVKIVSQADEIDAVDYLSSLSLHHPQGCMKEFIRGISTAEFKVEGLFCFIAYLDNIPVGQSFLAIHNNIPGLYFDSVHPDYRKQGIETEMVKTRMAFARDLGYSQIVAQCMASSVNVFQRVGFKPYGEISMYLYNPSKTI